MISMLTKISAGARITSSMALAPRSAPGPSSRGRRRAVRLPRACGHAEGTGGRAVRRLMSHRPFRFRMVGQSVGGSGRVRHLGVGDVGALVLGEGADDPEDQHGPGDLDDGYAR